MLPMKSYEYFFLHLTNLLTLLEEEREAEEEDEEENEELEGVDEDIIITVFAVDGIHLNIDRGPPSHC